MVSDLNDLYAISTINQIRCSAQHLMCNMENAHFIPYSKGVQRYRLFQPLVIGDPVPSRA